MTDEIPELLPPHLMPPIVDQASLEHTWRALIGKPGFDTPQLWVLFIDGDRPLQLMQVEDMPLACTDEDTTGLRDVLGHVPGISCAFLFARPGQRARTPADLTWAHGLTRLAHQLGHPRPVHLANDYELTVVAPDDLAAAS